HYHVHARGPETIQVVAVTTAPVAVRRAPGGSVLATVRAGTRLMVTSWQQDPAGALWYHSAAGWMAGDAVTFLTPNPGKVSVHGHPIWSPASGKGMWITLGTITDSNPDILVRAAQRAGVTHLYLES